MRILFIIPEEFNGDHWGGVTSYTLQLAQALRSMGNNVQILTPGTADILINYNNIVIHKRGSVLLKGSIWKIFKKVFPDFYDEINWLLHVLSFIKSHTNLDIVEAPEWMASTFFASLFTHVPIVIRLHRSLFMYKKDNELPFSFSDMMISLLEIFNICVSGAISSPTSYMMHVYNKYWFLHKPQLLRVIPNGTQIKKSKNIKTKKKFILYVGRLEKGKGVDILLHAFYELSFKVPSINLVLIGEDTTMYKKRSYYSFAGFLRNYIRQYNLEKRVTLLGKLSQKELIDFYDSCEIFVLASQGNENFSMALLEAISLAKPIIASNTGGNPEIVQNGKNGFLFTSQDSTDLFKKMYILLKNPNIQKNFARESKKLQKNYAIHTVAYDMLNFYQDVVKNVKGKYGSGKIN